MTFEKGDLVRVVKGRVAGDAIVGTFGIILGSTNDLKLFWIVSIDGKTYTDGDVGDLLLTDEIELIAKKVEFGQFEIYLRYSHDSFNRGWSYRVRYTPEHQLSLLENPFRYGSLPSDDYGMSLDYAILDAKRRTLEQVAEQIRLKQLHVQILESAMQSIEKVGAKA